MSWDGDAAAKSLFEWAEKTGGISKSKLAKYFLRVTGDGTKRGDYGFPVAKVVNGEPKYDLGGCIAAFAAASGARAGSVDREILRKVVALVAREFGVDSLTDGMKEFRKNNMSKTAKYFNGTAFGGKITYEDEDIIEVPVVLAKEGVFTGTDGQPRLKTFEELSASAKWFTGVPITPGHVRTPVPLPGARRIGQIVQVRARPERRDVFGLARFYKNELKADECEKIKAGLPFDGSIGYFCRIDETPGKFGDTEYDAVERGPYVITEYAALFDGHGACSVADGCGFFVNESYSNDSHENVIGGSNMTDVEKTVSGPAPDVVELEKMLNAAIEPLARRLEALEQKEKMAADTAKKDAFVKLLNAAARIDADKLYDEYVKDPAGWVVTNADKLLNSAAVSELKGKQTDGSQQFDLASEQRKLWGVE